MTFSFGAALVLSIRAAAQHAGWPPVCAVRASGCPGARSARSLPQRDGACERRYVPCNTSLPTLDPDFDDDYYNDNGEPCLVVNCSGRAAQLQGEIPCDLPQDTWALLLAGIGMTGNLSFQTLLERAPSMFGNGTLVDLHANALTGIQGQPASWCGHQLNAALDLSGNSITSIQQDALQGANINGNLDLSGNSITSIQPDAFAGATIDGQLGPERQQHHVHPAGRV